MSDQMSKSVSQVYDSYPKAVRTKLLEVRKLIFNVAAKIPEVSEIEETLRWNEPSYLTSKSKSGTMIRLGCKDENTFALYVHCQTNLIEQYRSLFPKVFAFEGTRGIVFDINNKLPKKELKHCIFLALTYKLR